MAPRREDYLDTLGFHLFDSKLIPNVREFLYNANLIHDMNDEQIIIEPKIALMYMNLLASHFASNSNDAVTLATDVKAYEDDFFKRNVSR